MNVDRTGIPEIVKAPDLVQKLIAGEDPVRGRRQVIQQFHLLRRCIDLLSVDHQLVGIQIDHQLVKGQLLIHRSDMIRPAHHRMDAGQQLFHFKRFGYIVVRTHLKAGDLVVCLSLGSQHDDGGRGLFPDVTADLPAVLARQHDIQHHDIRLEQVEIRFRLVPVRGDHDIKAVLGQVKPQQLGNIGIVFHHKCAFANRFLLLLAYNSGHYYNPLSGIFIKKV